jgi:hypothetical protein
MIFFVFSMIVCVLVIVFQYVKEAKVPVEIVRWRLIVAVTQGIEQVGINSNRSASKGNVIV